MEKLSRLTEEADVYYRMKINQLVDAVNELIDKVR